MSPVSTGRCTVSALVLVALLAAPVEAAVQVTDGTGRTLTLPALPRRIVSLVPGVTEMLYAIGAEDRLVGRTDFCDYPPAARNKPSVGGTVLPSLEGLVSLKPDLVVATSAGNSDETRRQPARGPATIPAATSCVCGCRSISSIRTGSRTCFAR